MASYNIEIRTIKLELKDSRSASLPVGKKMISSPVGQFHYVKDSSYQFP